MIYQHKGVTSELVIETHETTVQLGVRTCAMRLSFQMLVLELSKIHDNMHLLQ
jgi:hypothetical protein